jgi:hypothetical protein
MFMDTSMLLENHLHLRVTVGERERVKANKYGENCSWACALFPSLVLETRSAGIVQDHSHDRQEACDAGGS